MNLQQESNLALAAYDTLKKQFKDVVAMLKSVGPAVGVEVVDSTEVSGNLRILGWRYMLECHLSKISAGNFETKLVCFRARRGDKYDECYSLVFDRLGNFALGGHSSRSYHISIEKDIEWVCRDLVLIEAGHGG